MVKTIRVSEAFHGLVAAHNAGDETMEATLRRLIVGRGGARPAARFDEAAADRARTAVAALRARDGRRLRSARDAA